MISSFDTMGEKVSCMSRPLEIAVVDDEEPITELIRTFIEITSSEAIVHTFNDSAKARDFLRDHLVDVLITDYKMPQYDGIQLLQGVPESVTKVLISGYISEIAEEKLRGMKAQYFEKPVPIRALKKLLADCEAALENRKSPA